MSESESMNLFTPNLSIFCCSSSDLILSNSLLISCLHVQSLFSFAFKPCCITTFSLSDFLFGGKFSAFTETLLVVLTLAVKVDLFLSFPVGHCLSRSKLEMSTGHTILPLFKSLLGKIEGILLVPYLCPSFDFHL